MTTARTNLHCGFTPDLPKDPCSCRSKPLYFWCKKVRDMIKNDSTQLIQSAFASSLEELKKMDCAAGPLTNLLAVYNVEFSNPKPLLEEIPRALKSAILHAQSQLDLAVLAQFQKELLRAQGVVADIPREALFSLREDNLLCVGYPKVALQSNYGQIAQINWKLLYQGISVLIITQDGTTQPIGEHRAVSVMTLLAKMLSNPVFKEDFFEHNFSINYGRFLAVTAAALTALDLSLSKDESPIQLETPLYLVKPSQQEYFLCKPELLHQYFASFFFTY